MEDIVAIILLSLLSLGLIIAAFMLAYLHIELYFLRFKIENHPVLRAMVDDVLDTICKEEDIRVYHKSYDELNVDIKNESDKAVGMYVYVSDHDYQLKTRKIYDDITHLERKYRKPYKELCLEINEHNVRNADEYYFPRILLCADELLKFGLGSYYSTYFHELGHHFAIKNNEIRNEAIANKYGREIILKRLPFFFQLFSNFNFEFREGMEVNLTKKEKLKAYWGYFNYYIKNKKTIIKK